MSFTPANADAIALTVTGSIVISLGFAFSIYVIALHPLDAFVVSYASLFLDCMVRFSDSPISSDHNLYIGPLLFSNSIAPSSDFPYPFTLDPTFSRQLSTHQR